MPVFLVVLDNQKREIYLGITTNEVGDETVTQVKVAMLGAPRIGRQQYGFVGETH